MLNYVFTALISVIFTAISAFGIYNYLPLSSLEFGQKEAEKLGATITTIAGTDTISGSRTTINTNFTNLNNGKIENSSTSIAAITTLSNLATVGTINSGTWQGSVIDVARQGTGTTSPSRYQVLLGNGANGITIASGTGVTGQFLTSNGANAYPSWQTSAVDQGIAYVWTGTHRFGNNVTQSTTTTGTLNVGSIYASGTTFNIRGVDYNFPTSQGSTDQILTNDGTGVLTWTNRATTSIVMYPRGLGATTTTTFQPGVSNTTAYWGMIEIPQRITANTLRFLTGNISAGGRLKIMLYNETGDYRYASITTSALSASVWNSVTLSPALTLDPGNYFIGWSQEGTTDAILTTWACNSANFAGEPKMCGQSTISADTPPATINTTTITTGNNQALFIRLDN